MIIVNINGTEYQVSIAAGLNLSVANTKYPKLVRGDFFLSATVENSEGTLISPVVSGQTLTLPDVEVVVRYSNGLVADTFTGQPSAVNLDLTTSIFPPFEPEMIAKIEYAEANNIALPTALDLAKENNFIFLQKTWGLWTKKDISYWLRGSGSLSWKWINVINPGNFNITWLGGVVNTIDGVEGNGVNAQAITGYNGGIHGINYTLDSAMRSMYNYKTTTIGNILDGMSQVDNKDWFIQSGANTLLKLNSNPSLSIPVNCLGVGYKAGKRSDLTNVQLIINSTEYNGLLTADRLPIAVDGFSSFFSINGTAFSNSGFSFYSIGSNLTYAEAMQERSNILASL